MLRYKFPPFGLTEVDRSKEADVVIKRVVPATDVSFKKSSDVRHIIEAAKTSMRVQVTAAVGAGKSTRLPLELSNAMGKLIIHTVPFRLAARHLANYLTEVGGVGKVVYLNDVETAMPVKGVVMMSNTVLYARMISGKLGTGHVLYMDESHESDAATSFFRKVGHLVKNFSNVLYATATTDPGVELKPVLAGGREVIEYNRTPVDTWDVCDNNMPWSASEINGHVLIMMDNPVVRAKLRAAYTECGFDAYDCGSGLPDEQFDRVVADLKNPNSPIMILLCTYSYRSSFSFPCVTRFIESGEVGIPSVKDGRPHMYYRDVLDFEYQQFAGRAGRMNGLHTKVFKPRMEMAARLTDVEHLEGVAAILLYRMAGFIPPKDHAVFSELVGDVPIDIVGALQGDTPLQLIPGTHKEPWVKSGFYRRNTTTTAGYQYVPNAGRMPRVASCRTVVDSPGVYQPAKYPLMTSVLEERPSYPLSAGSSRTTSPDRVFTLSNTSQDNVRVYLEGTDTPAFQKPQRVSRRVRERNSAASLASEVDVAVGQVEVAEVSQVAEKVLPPLPDIHVRDKQSVRDGTPSVGKVGLPYVDAEVINSKLLGGGDVSGIRLTDEQLGGYYYYHGMSAAPEYSSYFVGGYPAVVSFANTPMAAARAAAIPASDKLYAMRLLVDVLNEKTATCVAAYRLMQEFKNRSAEDVANAISRDALRDVVMDITTMSSNARSEIHMVRDIMPVFQLYPLDKVGALVGMENGIIDSLMDKFEQAVACKDPGEVYEYFNRRNRPLALAEHAGRLRLGPAG